MQRIVRRMLAPMAVLATVAMVIAGCGSSTKTGASSSSPTTIRIAYMPDMHGGAIIAIANHMNYWQKAGVNPEVKSFSAGPPEIQALAAGDLDVAYIGPGAEWLCATGKCTVLTVDSLNIGDYVLAHPGSGIHSLADLKGKKIGVPLGTSGQMILDLALQKAGLTEKDIKIQPMDPASVVTAFVGGQLDAAAIWSPLTTQIEQRVPGTRELIDDAAFFPQYSFPQMWVASNAFVKQHPDAAQKFLRVFIQANDYRMTHISQAVTWTADLAHVPAAGLQAQATTTKWLSSSQIQTDNQNGTTYQWLDGLNQQFVHMQKMSSPGNAKTFVNVDLFAKAMQGS